MGYQLKTPKAAAAVVKVHKGIEKGVVGAYKGIEGAVVGAYKKVEDKFVETFLEEDPRPQAEEETE